MVEPLHRIQGGPCSTPDFCIKLRSLSSVLSLFHTQKRDMLTVL